MLKPAAYRDLMDQAERLCGEGATADAWPYLTVSLDSLWRAAFKPPAKTPSAWRLMAAPLLDGARQYEKSAGFRTVGRFETWEPDLEDPADSRIEGWEIGDVLAPSWIGFLYAAWLDRDELEETCERQVKRSGLDQI